MKKLLLLGFLAGCATAPKENVIQMDLNFKCSNGRGLAEACEEICQYLCPKAVREGSGTDCGAERLLLMGVWVADCKCNYSEQKVRINRLPPDPNQQEQQLPPGHPPI